MGETSDAIMEHIDDERRELEEDLGELEERAKGLTDWRTQFDQHPLAMTSIAFGGGLLLSTLLGGRSKKNGQEHPKTYKHIRARYRHPHGQSSEGIMARLFGRAKTPR